MPSSSKKQHKFMEAIAHNPAFAKKVGIPQSVGKDFSTADKGKTFKKGGDTMATKRDPKMMAALMAARKRPSMPVGGRMAADNQMMQAGAPQPGTPGMPMKKGGRIKKMAAGGMTKDDRAQDKKMIKKAFKQHDAQEHKGGKGTKLALKKGGMMKKMAGGGLAAGHKAADGVASKGKTKGAMVKMAKGGRYC
jgi:hypothetical protein